MILWRVLGLLRGLLRGLPWGLPWGRSGPIFPGFPSPRPWSGGPACG